MMMLPFGVAKSAAGDDFEFLQGQFVGLVVGRVHVHLSLVPAEGQCCRSQKPYAEARIVAVMDVTPKQRWESGKNFIAPIPQNGPPRRRTIGDGADEAAYAGLP